jgi:hypothetical protein
MTDDDLVGIIRTGIPNTPILTGTMTVEQAQKIVAYLRARHQLAPERAAAMQRAGAHRRRQGRLRDVSQHRRRGRGSAPISAGSAAARRAGTELALVEPARGTANQPFLPRRAD